MNFEFWREKGELYTIRSLRYNYTHGAIVFMNPHRKVQNFHINYLGHYILDIPYEYKFLAYCHEEEAKEHTHIVLQTKEGVSKTELIRELTKHLEIPCSIEVEVHKNIQTAIGYHIGLGNKPRCNHFIVIEPAKWNADEYIRSKIMHSKQTVPICRERNKILLAKRTKDLVDDGDIPLEKIMIIEKSKNEYKRITPDLREDIPPFLPNPWQLLLSSKVAGKKRHYWIYSRQPNKGKTYHFAKPLVAKYKFYLQVGDFTYWNFRGDEQGIILDEYNTAKLGWAQLNSIADGTFSFRVIHVGLRTLENPLIIILSNQSIDELYPHMNNFIHERFIEHEIL